MRVTTIATSVARGVRGPSALGRALGRRVSQNDLSDMLRLAGPNGARTVRRWEEETGPTGPAATALTFFAAASGLVPGIAPAVRSALLDLIRREFPQP